MFGLKMTIWDHFNQKTEKKMIKVSRKKSKNIYSIKKSFYTFSKSEFYPDSNGEVDF